VTGATGFGKALSGVLLAALTLLAPPLRAEPGAGGCRLAPVAISTPQLSALAVRLDDRNIDQLYALRRDPLAATTLWFVPLGRLDAERRDVIRRRVFALRADYLPATRVVYREYGAFARLDGAGEARAKAERRLLEAGDRRTVRAWVERGLDAGRGRDWLLEAVAALSRVSAPPDPPLLRLQLRVFEQLGSERTAAQIARELARRGAPDALGRVGRAFRAWGAACERHAEVLGLLAAVAGG